MEPLSKDFGLVYIALISLVIVIGLSAYVILRTNDEVDVETRKVRFAAATFTGLLMLFVFSAVLYWARTDDANAGKNIFDKAITAMTPLAGAIVGYMFGVKKS